MSDRAAEAGAEQEGVRHAGPADQTRDANQSELRLQATHRGAKGVTQRQGAACQYAADRGQYTLTQNTSDSCYATVDFSSHLIFSSEGDKLCFYPPTTTTDDFQKSLETTILVSTSEIVRVNRGP